jgi:Polyketide cyclase / dehydrase and lipid transport
MKRLLERTFDVEAAAERAWAELVAAERWPRWARHLASVQVTPPGPVGPGSRATLKLTNHTRATMRVTEFQDGRRFRWEGSFLWLGLGYDHLVTTDQTGRVQITFTVEGAGVGVNTIGPLFAGVYARNLDRAIPRLQALLRSPAGHDPGRVPVPEEPTEGPTSA